MTDWPDAIRRGVDALDFELGVKHARPPGDQDGLRAMFAAEQFHNMLPVIAASSGSAPARAAEEVRRLVEASSRADRPSLVRRYRIALAAALEGYIDGSDDRIAELIKWREQDRKAVDD